jgi:hypothetical protein
MAESAAFWARRPTGGGPLPAVPTLAPDDDPYGRAARRAPRAAPRPATPRSPRRLAAAPSASLACLWRSAVTVSRSAARLWSEYASEP